jgi:hypothetical protein
MDMKYRFEMEMPENKLAIALEFLKSLSFIKNVKEIPVNEITNERILKRIEEYESGNSEANPAHKIFQKREGIETKNQVRIRHQRCPM